MTEYFIVANTFAMPFVSETLYKYIVAETAREAFLSLLENCEFPIYSAAVYQSADDYHKLLPALYKYLSGKAKKDMSNE